MKLYDLSIGQHFEFVYSPAHYRNLRIKNKSECCVCIEGEIKKDNVWKPLGPNYTVSTNCEVTPMQNLKLIETIKNNEHRVSIKSGGRGRPKMVRDFVYPDGEFTVASLVELWKASQPQVNKFVNEGLTNDKIICIKQITKGRGRPQRVFVLKKTDKETILACEQGTKQQSEPISESERNTTATI